MPQHIFVGTRLGMKTRRDSCQSTLDAELMGQGMQVSNSVSSADRQPAVLWMYKHCHDHGNYCVLAHVQLDCAASQPSGFSRMEGDDIMLSRP